MSDEPIARWSGADALDGIRSHLKLLGDMFLDEGLGELRQRYPEHPAVLHHDTLIELERRDLGTEWPNEFEAANAMATLGLDFSTWAPRPPYDDFWGFLDAETRDWTLGELRKPDQFEDAMAELFTWGWLRSNDFQARRINEEGLSDIVLDQSSDPWHCEVKRIHVGTGASRIASNIADANKKIKLIPKRQAACS